MLPTWFQDVVIDRLEGPASWVEGATGRSFQYVTASLYAVTLLLPVESILLFGGRPVGLALLPVFVGFVGWRARDALRLAARGPAHAGARAMSRDRSDPYAVGLRTVWTAVTAVTLCEVALRLAAGGHPRGTFLVVPMLAFFVALHLHACSPPAARPRARPAGAAA